MTDKKVLEDNSSEYHGRYEAEPVEKPLEYKGRYEAEEISEDTLPRENEEVKTYQGRYASDVDNSYKTDSVTEHEDFYRAKHDAGSMRPAVEIAPAPPADYGDGADASEIIARSLKKADEKVKKERRMAETQKRRNSKGRTNSANGRKGTAKKQPSRKRKKQKNTKADHITKAVSIVTSLVLVFALLLNMPVLLYKKSGQPDERVSVVNYFRRWQPTVNIEGQLNKNTMDLKLNTDVIENEYTDGLDLPQLVEGQYSVLFIGFDESRMLTDVVWVCEFDIGNGQLNILQVPRDLAVPDYTNSITTKFNSIYTEGDYYVSPPIQRVVNAVQDNFGIPIDAYITTSCFDIASMVDLIGGIPMHVENEIMYEADKIIPAGDVVLNGAQAEWFVRFRRLWTEGDIGRMQNQRKFMAAAMQKLLSIVKDEGRTKLYGYLNTIYQNEWLATNMSIGDLGKLADFASTLHMETVKVNMVPGEGAKYLAEDGMEYDIYSVHKYAAVTMLNQNFRPYQQPLKLDDVALVEYITDYNYRIYDDTGMTLDAVEKAEEPERRSDIQ